MSALADAVFVLHGAFIMLIIPSAILALSGAYKNTPRLWAVHNLSILAMVAGLITFQRCVLVVLEEWLRAQAGDTMPYTGSYVRHVVDQLTGVTLPPGFVMLSSIAIALTSLAAMVKERNDAAPSAMPEAVAESRWSS